MQHQLTGHVVEKYLALIKFPNRCSKTSLSKTVILEGLGESLAGAEKEWWAMKLMSRENPSTHSPSGSKQPHSEWSRAESSLMTMILFFVYPVFSFGFQKMWL